MKKLSINISVLVFLFTFLLIINNHNSYLLCQTKNLRFDHLSIKDGLPDDGLQCIIQDHLGFLWIGTRNGLSKYDGYNFVNYYYNDKDTNSITGRNVRYIMEDSQGDIWVGTFSGLSIFIRDENRFVNYRHDKNNQNSLSNNSLRKIYEDTKKNIWIGTLGGGLNFINKKSLLNKKSRLEFQTIKLDKPVEKTEYILDIKEDSKNIIWVATRNGLLKISDENIELIQPVKGTEYNQKNHFLCLELDHNGIIWIGTYGNGIARFDKMTNKFVFYCYDNLPFRNYSPNNIMSLLLDSRGNLWAGPKGGDDAGLFLFNRKTKKYTRFLHDPLNPYSISKDNAYIRSIIEDNNGNIWFTTHEGKINIINQQKNIFRYYRKFLKTKKEITFSIQTRMIEGQNGRIWFAAINGLFEFFPNKNNFLKIEVQDQNNEQSLNDKCRGVIEDKEGNLWTAGHNVKLRRYNPNSRILTNFNKIISLSNPNVHCILEDNDGTIWLGTWKGGLDKYNPSTNEIINYKNIPDDTTSISNNVILKLCKDSSNTIWISTNDCMLNKLNKNIGKFKRISLPLNVGYICRFFVDSKNRLWAGTNIGGILLFNTKDDSYKRINTNHGLPSNNYVTGFSEDHNGNIYCCTGSYLIKFNPNAVLEKYYDIATEDEVLHTTYYTKKTQEIFVISDKGFYRFFPDSLKPNLIPPKMVLTNLDVMNQPMKVGKDSPLKTHINVAKNIVLDFWQNDISIQYAAIHYINPSENKYKYKLENFDDQWRNAGKNRVATYTNLSHGEYTFKVLGSNSDGIWSTEPATLAITILPPWWLTWGAYLIYALIFITILSFLYFLQKRRLRIIHELEMKEFETEKLKEVDEIKSKFFANISHEFRTPLTLIKGPVERLIENKKVDDPQKIYRMIKRNSERLLNLINELLDLSKLESGKMKLSAQKGDIVSFTKAIVMSFESLAEKKEIQINISSSNDLIELYFDKEKMQKIISNLLSNAFKFTQEGGKITVGIKEESNEQRVQIKISDNGIGIPQKELPKIFDRFYQAVHSNSDGYEGTGIGLSLTKELVDIHYGGISVESEERNLSAGKTGGTTFTLWFPLGKEHLKEEELIYIDYETIPKEELICEKTDTSISAGEDKPQLLIVEDNKDIRDFIISIIENKYRIVEAENGEEGLNRALEQIPDLIISDIMMPKLSGDKMCERLKKDQITCHIPIILLTAKSSGEDRINGLETGADDYLIKPFNEKELLVRINNLIVQRRNLREKYLREAEIHPTEVAVTSLDKKFIERMIKIVEENISNTKFNVEQLAAELFISRTQVYRKFISVLGEKPNEFIRKYRIKRAAELIRKKYDSVTQIAYEVGFNDLSYFAKCFKKIYKKTPHEFEKNHLNHKQK